MRVGDQRRELGKIVVDEGLTQGVESTRGMAPKQGPRVLYLYENSTGRISDEHAVQLENECVRILWRVPPFEPETTEETWGNLQAHDIAKQSISVRVSIDCCHFYIHITIHCRYNG